jgi:hypothetical protein
VLRNEQLGTSRPLTLLATLAVAWSENPEMFAAVNANGISPGYRTIKIYKKITRPRSREEEAASG